MENLTKTRWRAIAFSGFGLALLTLAPAQAASARAKPTTRLILKLNRPIAPADEVRLAKAGAFIYRHLPMIDSVAVSVPARTQSKVRSLPFVGHVSPDLAVRKSDLFTVGSSKADEAWNQFGVTGSGVGVAVLDSGIGQSRDLGDSLGASRVVASANFTPEQNADDGCGHGTHVAGIIGGNGAESSGFGAFRTFLGIAPQSNLINVRVLDSSGTGSVSQVCAGIQWVISQKSALNIRVLNISLGHPVGESYLTDPLCQAVERAWNSGIVVVCAAGNGGRLREDPKAGESNEGFGVNYGSIDCPGNDPYVITVGAMKSTTGNRENDAIATYSGRGPTRLDFFAKPDLVAPGNRVVSLLANGSTLDQFFGDLIRIPWNSYSNVPPADGQAKYAMLSGTSMATPVVSAAAALMLQQDRTLSPDTVKIRLMASATKWAFPSGEGSAVTFGAGYVDVAGALSSTLVARRPVTSPRLVWSPTGFVFILVDPDFWGSGVGSLGLTDGNATLRGTRAIWGERAIWGTRAMWGTGTGPLYPDRAMWGTSTWGDKSVSAQSAAGVGIGRTTVQGDR